MRQRKVKRYSKLREELQLAGEIPTSAEGAVWNEVVDPSSQSEQPLPVLIGTAIRRGWATPEEKKPRLVDEMIKMVECQEVGEVQRVMAYNALVKGDQLQWERDHPSEAGKTKGGSAVNVNVIDWQRMAISSEHEPDRIEERIKLEGA